MSQRSEEYLATKEEQKIVQKVLTNYQIALNEKSELHQKWRKFEDYYKNRHWKYKKVQNERVKPTVNYAFAIVETLMPFLTSNVPEPVVLPTKPEDEDTARDLTTIAKILLKKNGIEDILQISERGRLKFGTSIIKVFFDPTKYQGLGDVSFENVDLANFFIDPNCVGDLQDAAFCGTAVKRSLQYVKTRYPDKAHEVQPDRQFSQLDIYGTQDVDVLADEDYVTLIEYWEKHPEKGLIRAVVAGETLLKYEENFYQHGKYPFVEAVDYPIQKSFYGMGEYEQLIVMQDILNKLLQIVIENVSLANGQLLVDKTSSGIKNVKSLADNLWKPGLTIPVNDINSVKKLDGVVAPSWVINLIQLIQNDIELVTGISPTLLGMAPGSVTAASGIIALQEQATARVRLKLREQAKMIEKLVGFIIDYMTEFYDEDRYFRYLSKNREPSWIVLNKKDLQDDKGFQRQFDVTVEVGYDAPMSRAYIEQQAMQLYQMGIIDAVEVLKTMNFPYKDEILNRLNKKANVMAEIGKLPEGASSPALNSMLAQLTALENQSPSMPDGLNVNNTNSPQDSNEQREQASPNLANFPSQG